MPHIFRAHIAQGTCRHVWTAIDVEQQTSIVPFLQVNPDGLIVAAFKADEEPNKTANGVAQQVAMWQEEHPEWKVRHSSAPSRMLELESLEFVVPSSLSIIHR